MAPKATEGADTKPTSSLTSPSVWQEPATSPWRGRIVRLPRIWSPTPSPKTKATFATSHPEIIFRSRLVPLHIANPAEVHASRIPAHPTPRRTRRTEPSTHPAPPCVSSRFGTIYWGCVRGRTPWLVEQPLHNHMRHDRKRAFHRRDGHFLFSRLRSPDGSMATGDRFERIQNTRSGFDGFQRQQPG